MDSNHLIIEVTNDGQQKKRPPEGGRTFLSNLLFFFSLDLANQ